MDRIPNTRPLRIIPALEGMFRRFVGVQYGGGILQMRGSIGGQTHSRNRYGNYIRTKTNPVNPATSRQNEVRGNLGDMVNRWQNTLTEVQRQLWNTYAANVTMTNKFGESINLTGFNHFIRSNCSRVQAGVNEIDAGPTDFTLPGMDEAFDVAATADDDMISVTFDDTKDWCDCSQAYMAVFTGLPKSSAIGFFGGPWRFAGAILGTSGGVASPQELQMDFDYATGHRCFAKARIGDSDGRLSAEFRDNAIVAAS